MTLPNLPKFCFGLALSTCFDARVARVLHFLFHPKGVEVSNL